LDARTYMLELPEDRGLRAQWQRACESLLAEADVAALSRQIELALFLRRQACPDMKSRMKCARCRDTYWVCELAHYVIQHPQHNYSTRGAMHWR
jgi:hypothetical protein